MQLLFLLFLLVFPCVVLSLAGRRIPRLKLSSATHARVGLSIFFVFTGTGHFIRTEGMIAMLPSSIPYRFELVYVTGVLELLGAVGIWIPALRKLTGICLMVMLLGILPSNIYSAINHVDFGGHAAGPVYLLVRIPFQLFVMWWTYLATEQDWFG